MKKVNAKQAARIMPASKNSRPGAEAALAILKVTVTGSPGAVGHRKTSVSSLSLCKAYIETPET